MWPTLLLSSIVLTWNLTQWSVLVHLNDTVSVTPSPSDGEGHSAASPPVQLITWDVSPGSTIAQLTVYSAAIPSECSSRLVAVVRDSFQLEHLLIGCAAPFSTDFLLSKHPEPTQLRPLVRSNEIHDESRSSSGAVLLTLIALRVDEESETPSGYALAIFSLFRSSDRFERNCSFIMRFYSPLLNDFLMTSVDVGLKHCAEPREVSGDATISFVCLVTPEEVLLRHMECDRSGCSVTMVSQLSSSQFLQRMMLFNSITATFMTCRLVAAPQHHRSELSRRRHVPEIFIVVRTDDETLHCVVSPNGDVTILFRSPLWERGHCDPSATSLVLGGGMCLSTSPQCHHRASFLLVHEPPDRMKMIMMQNHSQRVRINDCSEDLRWILSSSVCGPLSLLLLPTEDGSQRSTWWVSTIVAMMVTVLTLFPSLCSRQATESREAADTSCPSLPEVVEVKGETLADYLLAHRVDSRPKLSPR